MRPMFLAACVLASAGTASAQDAEPQPFMSTELSARGHNRELIGLGPTVGFDVTFGARSWRGLQPIVQGGRLIDVTPADGATSRSTLDTRCSLSLAMRMLCGVRHVFGSVCGSSRLSPAFAC